jgi:AraC family transcriptional regulator
MKMRTYRIAVLFLLVASALTPLLADESDPPTRVYLKRTEPHSMATMKHKGPYSEVPHVINRIAKAIGAGGYNQAGPITVAYYNDPGQTPEAELLWEVRIPVAYPGPMGSTENDEMGFRYFDPTFVAYTYHIGSYAQVGAAYTELMEWAGRNKYQIIGPPVEIYWSDPANVTEDMCVTEIQFPVLEKKIPGGIAE